VRRFDVSAAAGSGAEWRYGGDERPVQWATLDPAYATCGTGRSQSPIDLRGAQHAPAATLKTAYRAATSTVVDNGHTIEAEAHRDAGSIMLGSTRYELLQFHSHAPSEHTLAGVHYPLELHLVHRSAGGRLAVIGVLVREGAEHGALSGVFSHLPAQDAEEESELNPADLLPADQAGYRYSGSLTTPPCTEGVRWIVLQEPIELSRDQILVFTHRYFGTNRPVHPLNGRLLAQTN
jgi:carbonic anhydrase